MDNMDNNENNEIQNRKDFIKEVMGGTHETIPRKTTLKEFLIDSQSYKQFRDQVDECMFFIDWNKIHRVMKTLKWKWTSWEDENYNDHYDTVPSVYGIKKNVYKNIKRMEDWVLAHGDVDHYCSASGGFEYEMKVCKATSTDDFDGRVKLVVRFVVDQFDTGM